MFCLVLSSKPLPLCSPLQLVSATKVNPLSFALFLVSFFSFLDLRLHMYGRRSMSRVRPRREQASPDRNPGRIRDVDLDQVDPWLMLQYLRNAGHLDDSDPSGSSVPVQPPADEVARTTLASIEALMQRLLAQAPPVVPAPTPPTAPSASAPATATTGKAHLKFPDPPMFEGDPVKLDGWLTQTQMYLKAYDVDLASSRAADVATMF